MHAYTSDWRLAAAESRVRLQDLESSRRMIARGWFCELPVDCPSIRRLGCEPLAWRLSPICGEPENCSLADARKEILALLDWCCSR